MGATSTDPIERIAFHFDPICPWAWITSRWAARLEELGQLAVEWRLFSLGLANLAPGDPAGPGPVGKSGPALEALVLAGRLGGNASVAGLYAAMGQAAFERGEDPTDPPGLDQVWSTAGLDPSDLRASAGDPSLWAEVVSDHEAAVTQCQAFGVPTLILDAGHGPGIFGPVITEVPSDEESAELLHDVLRMARRRYVMELKRDRPHHGAGPTIRQ